MNQKTIQQIIHQFNQNSAGFTLTELLAVIAITSFLVAGTGVGLSTLLQRNVDNEEELLQQQNTNRALDFIAEEIKMAVEIGTGSTGTSNFGKDCSDADIECVLNLRLPDVPERIIYYTESASDPWEDPRVLRRWGPNFCNNGSYSKLSSITTFDSSTDTITISSGCFDDTDTVQIDGTGSYAIDTVTTSSASSTLTFSSSLPSDLLQGDPIIQENVTTGWSGNVLIDGIADSTTAPTCNGSDTLSVPGGVGGVYACLSSDNRKAELTLIVEGEENYQLQGKAFARSSD